MKITIKSNFVTPKKILQIENHRDILEFRCLNINILFWPLLRDNIFNLLLLKLFYKNWINYNLEKNYLYIVINKFFFSPSEVDTVLSDPRKAKNTKLENKNTHL